MDFADHPFRERKLLAHHGEDVEEGVAMTHCLQVLFERFLSMGAVDRALLSFAKQR